MVRIRSIKPQLFRHAELFDAEQNTKLPLRLAFIGLILCADKEGRFYWKPRELKLDVLPFDHHIDFATVLDALLEHQFIIKYCIDNITYGCIPSWHKHQVINPREHRSLIPAYQSTSHVTARSENIKNSPSHSDVLEVFQYWKNTMAHPNAKCDKARKNLIQYALAQGYTKEQLCMAIQGCKQTPYHMGNNPQGQCYDSLKVILRDADQIDKFLRHYHSPPKPLNTRQRRTADNLKVLQDWVDNNQVETITINHSEVNHEHK